MKKVGTLLVIGGTLLLASGCGGDDSSGSPGGGYYQGQGAGGDAGSSQGGSSGQAGASGKAGQAGSGQAGSSAQAGASGSAGQGGSGQGGASGGGASGSAGSGGGENGGSGGSATGGGAGQGGAGGGAAGGAGGGAGTAAAGSAGAAGTLGGAGKAGSGTSGSGGSSAGSGGSGGASAGSGGSSGSGGVVATEGIGQSCVVDGDCAQGLKCLTKLGADGIPGGLCTLDCSGYLSMFGSAGAPPSVPDPCDPSQTGAAVCLRTSNDGEPATGACFQTCIYGEPVLFGDQNHLLGSPAEPGKCSGREDFGCYPVDYTDNGQLFAYCKPACQSDLHCNEGDKCDLTSGTCVAASSFPSGLKKNGAQCEVGVICTTDADCTKPGQTCVIASGQTEGTCTDPNAPRECEGYCVRLYGDTAPKAQQSIGICIDPCLAGPGDQACGGIESGVCDINLFAPAKPGSGSTAQYQALGFQDIGGCQKAVSKDDDAGCLWQQGVFASYVSGLSESLCDFARECSTLNDCGYTCQVDADCAPSTTKSTCQGGMCKLSGGALYTGNNTCVAVDALCGKKYCLDHTPTLPKPSTCP